MQLEAHLRLCRCCFRCPWSGWRMLSQSSALRKAVNYYDLLGVKSDATLDEIKNAFFDKSKKLHPDSDPSNPDLHSQFVQLNEAYRVLSKEMSRKEYDHITQSRSTAQVFRSTSSRSTTTSGSSSSRSSSSAHDNTQYWEQFHHPQSPEMTARDKEERNRKNLRLVGYCLLAMLFSIGAHTLFFKKLEEVHTKYMDEKDRVITQMYNEARERARVNSFKEQMDILRQKHVEFQEKYRKPGGGEEK